MTNILNYPRLVFIFAFTACWLAAILGGFCRVKLRPVEEEERADFGVVQAAALTLLGLLIGFTFSMATGRYEQRKNYEEAEANAVGTEYVRADLLPTADAAKVRVLLKNYLDQRMLYYKVRHEQELPQISAQVARLQTEMWSAVAILGVAQPTPVRALSVAGMN